MTICPGGKYYDPNNLQTAVDDAIGVLIVSCAGNSIANVRLTSQDFVPLFWSGAGTWDNSSTAKWSPASGGPYNQTWTTGKDAVFQGTTPGTVTVSGTMGCRQLDQLRRGWLHARRQRQWHQHH